MSSAPIDWKARVGAALAAAGSDADADVVEELSQHAAAEYEAARADGRPQADAEHHVDALVDAWCRNALVSGRRPRRPTAIEPPATRGRLLAGVLQDARHGLRLLRREPGFAFVAILTIALGIGATTTLFSVTNGVLLKPLPWPDTDRLIRISEQRQGHAPRIRGTITNGTYIAWHEQHDTIEDVGGWRVAPATASVGAGAEPVRLQTAAVTPSLFAVLKVSPLRGRVLVEDDARPGGDFVARDVIVISHGLWQEWFGGRDDALGAVVQVAGKPLTVVGIMPGDFAFPDAQVRAWTPWAMAAVNGQQGARRVAIFSAIARLRSGATVPQAAAEATARAREAPDPGLAAVAMFGGNGPAEITAVAALDMMTAEVRPALMVLLAAVVLLLATATANVASLQLARATARRREMAIRAAIGAGVGRLTRQLIVESALVGAAGGIAGFALAAMLHRALPYVLPADFPRAADVAIDGRVWLFVVAISMIASVACGVLPALHARRLNLVESLSDGGGAPVGGMRSATARARALIMVGQLAVSCMLLVGASLLARSFVSLLHADRGYHPANLLTARIPLPAGFAMERRTQLLDEVTARLGATPGVVEAAYGNALPLLTSGGFRAFKMRPPANPAIEVDVNTMQRVVSPAYFAALGVRLRSGRGFADTDTMTSQQVIVVNRSFAAKYLGENAIGASVPNLGMCRGDNDRWAVVGVVDDVRQGGVDDAPQAEIFMPYRQVGCPTAVAEPIVVVRTKDDPLPYAAVLRRVVREQAPMLALDSVMTMEDRVMTTLAKPRLYAVVLAGFGVFAVSIAGVGLFGVLSYSVAQRAREIGVRTALGASPAVIVRLVLRQVAIIAVAGTAIGLWLAFAATSWLTTFLYGVGPHDAWSFAGVAAAIAVVSAAASIVPARRAARVDPIAALRAD